MTQSVAFLGLGLMGAPMAVNLVRRGFTVKAWNRNPERPSIAVVREAGASLAKSIAEAVADTEVIFTCLGDVPDVKEVILGADGVAVHAPREALVVDYSTIGSNAAREIAAALKPQGLRFMDAPISGGDIGAEQGTLTIMVGGEEKDFAQCQPLFQAMGKEIRLCGPVGSGQAVKLCNQVLAAIHMVALCEGMELAKIQGVDPQLMVEVCQTGAAGSWALANLGPKIIEADYNPGFTIQHILKDLRLVQETLETALPGVDLAERLFKLVSKLDQGEGTQQGTQAMIRAYDA